MKVLVRKTRIVAIAAAALTVAGFSPASYAQMKNARPTDSGKPKIIYIVPHRTPPNAETAASIRAQVASGQTIALWTYKTVAQDGKTYTGTMVGRSPFAHGHRVTTIPTYIIPVIFSFSDSGDVFDPTASGDSCAPNSESVVQLIHDSPLFQTVNFTMNGVAVGNTQYLDGFQRANFWSKVGGTPYHTAFSTSPTVLPAIQVTVPTNYGVTQSYADFGGCHDLGQIDQGWWNNLLQTQIIPQLASEGVGPANLPQFVSDSVVEYLNGNPSNCCALGYHDSFMNNSVFQTYSMNAFDTSGAFGNENTSTMSHEIAEWMDDPDTSNAVPSWGAEGQVTAGHCQANLEVGDPLSPNFGTPTSPIYVGNGTVTYTLQELAFYSWFLGSSPSLGAGGGYSNNGTFRGYAKACPPGGTN